MTVTEVVDDGEGLQVAYEELRGYALGNGGTGGRGLLILLREGLAAWLAHRCGEAIDVPRSSRRAGGPRMAEELHRDVVRVLASMVLGHQEKETTA